MTMVAATAEFESAVAVARQQTQTDAPSETSNPTETQPATATPIPTVQPSAVPSSTPSQSADVFEVVQQRSSDNDASVYTVLIDEYGEIIVEVPIEWADVDITPQSLDGVTESPSIMASSDLTSFYQGWGEPGIVVQVSSSFTETFASPAEYLDYQKVLLRMGAGGRDNRQEPSSVTETA